MSIGGPFFVLKFVRSRGISSTVSKVRIDRKVLFKQKKGRYWPLMGDTLVPNWGYVTETNSRDPRSSVGNGPNTVSGSTVSNTELSEFSGLIEFRGANSVSSFQPIICVCKRELTEFFAEPTEFAPKLSEAQ